MTKKAITKEEIESLIKDDHYFRRKTVNGHNYITARKGDKEISLGPFSEDIWEYIQQKIKAKVDSQHNQNPPTLNHSVQKMEGYDAIQNEMRQISDSMRTYLGAYKTGLCLFVGEDRYCQYWRIHDKPIYLDMLRKQFGNDAMVKVKEKNGSEYWAVKAFGFTCRDCTAFLDERMLNFLREHLNLDVK